MRKQGKLFPMDPDRGEAARIRMAEQGQQPVPGAHIVEDGLVALVSSQICAAGWCPATDFPMMSW